VRAKDATVVVIVEDVAAVTDCKDESVENCHYFAE
jgi:hypothetical protein